MYFAILPLIKIVLGITLFTSLIFYIRGCTGGRDRVILKIRTTQAKAKIEGQRKSRKIELKVQEYKETIRKKEPLEERRKRIREVFEK